jgi:glycosyltransferase involved in cell wall biosynthesis
MSVRTLPHSTPAPTPTPTPELAFVIPAFNEEATLAETVRRCSAAARRLGLAHEIVVVDDGSSDGTLEVARALIGAHPLRALRLSRNFGKEQALMAGLHAARGGLVVTLDADLQEPLEALDAMLARRAEGFEMVYAVRADRADEGWAKRRATRLFYRLLGLGAQVPIPPDARDFRLMDRRVVDALLALPERDRFMKGLFAWIGFRTAAVPVAMAPRAGGGSKFGPRALARLALTGLTGFTDWPLRVWTGIGFGVAGASILYGFWIALKTLLWGVAPQGWATLAVALFFLGGVQLLSIGVLGEYLSRVFVEVKGRPGYIVAETFGAETAPAAALRRAAS